MPEVESAAPALPALPERFTQVELLGRGAQAITVAAHDTQRDRPVAIKVLDLHGMADWKAYERFERERSDARVTRAVLLTAALLVSFPLVLGAPSWLRPRALIAGQRPLVSPPLAPDASRRRSLTARVVFRA